MLMIRMMKNRFKLSFDSTIISGLLTYVNTFDLKCYIIFVCTI